MNETILSIEEAKNAINSADNLHDLLHGVKSLLLGKDSPVAQLTNKMKDATTEEKRDFGRQINQFKKAVSSDIDLKRRELEGVELEKKLNDESVDITIPYGHKKSGSLHPITKTIHEIKTIFSSYGFLDVHGPEIEEDFYNFTALNVKQNHPARQMQDTFYLNGKNEKDEHYLLRTHTTSVDVRHILQNKQIPINLMSCGKTFRNDSDRTHSPMFHQFEGLMIDKGINMGHLKWILHDFLSKFFETDDIVIRFRPSHFPFTEPSAEVDIGYTIKDGRIEIGGDKEFLEILGCGMLHPNVLENCEVDHKLYNGLAFGGGVERIAMLKHGITDLREFSNSNLDWLKHYGFQHFDLT